MTIFCMCVFLNTSDKPYDMNILLLNWQDITNPLAGGAETHLHEIFSRVAACGHSVTLYCSSYSGAKPAETLDGLHIIREGHRNTFNAYVPIRYRSRFQHEGFDVVVDDVNKIPFFTPLYVREPLLAIAHHLFGTSAFAEVGVAAGLYVYAAETLLNQVYRRTPWAVVSPSTRDEFIARGFPAENLSIIYNCIDQAQFPFAPQPKPSSPTVAYFGRLKRYKSVHHLIEAFALVVKRLPEAQLQIMGKGDDEPRLRDLVARLGIDKQVHFLGFIPEHKKASALGAVHCVVNPSMKEGWGIINIEANACGTPVISANSQGLRDSVRHGESGLLYEYGNIEELAGEIMRVLQDDELRTYLSAGAIRFARGFDWNDAAQQMIQRLEGVIDEHSSNSKPLHQQAIQGL
jgi:glycosyltransferase involved in cell wall biosynthesis